MGLEHHADISTEADQWSASAWALDTSLARTAYGLYGYGQTVAIIDSGIAYDHTALGQGLGPGHRVVGGWDFAESDADPYDDGPLGFHGTHVAGIVGSDDNTYTGVSPGVDLVALRVFDDQGHSDAAWITSALWWVHQHQHTLEFPITTVNLSLGISHVDAATRVAIDSALQVLEDDGMFISVAAGNDFRGNTEVKFPAASDYATPVASVGPAGMLSGFSMRDSRVLAAPGESVVSTVPDYLFGFDGMTDDFLAVSGTSMAAPHVAGASVLLREMHAKLGNEDLDPRQLYQEFVQTADIIYDSVTSANYWRLNLKKALDNAIGVDEASDTSIGSLQSTATFSGTVHHLQDVDTFTFTASQTGELTLETAWTGPADQRPSIRVDGATPTGPGRFQVLAGQTYTLSMTGRESIGRYSGQLWLRPTHTGVIAAAPSARSNQTIQTWTAPAAGWYDIQIHVDAPDRVDMIRVYGGDGQLRYVATEVVSEHHVQLQLAAGERVSLALLGSRPAAEVAMTGVSVSQGGPNGQVGQSSLLAAMACGLPEPMNHRALTRPGALALEAESAITSAEQAFTVPLDPAWLDRIVDGHTQLAWRQPHAADLGGDVAHDELGEWLFVDSLSLLVSLHGEGLGETLFANSGLFGGTHCSARPANAIPREQHAPRVPVAGKRRTCRPAAYVSPHPSWVIGIALRPSNPLFSRPKTPPLVIELFLHSARPVATSRWNPLFLVSNRNDVFKSNTARHRRHRLIRSQLHTPGTGRTLAGSSDCLQPR